MNVKGRKAKNQEFINNSIKNAVPREEMSRRKAEIKAGLKAFTWHELETNGKFAKNDKLSFISDEVLILGCDVGRDAQYMRAIDARGRELSREAFITSKAS